MTDQPYLMVTVSFATDQGSFRAGELIDADHPVVKKYRDHFGPVIIQHQWKRKAEVEQATAAPGEKRAR